MRCWVLGVGCWWVSLLPQYAAPRAGKGAVNVSMLGRTSVAWFSVDHVAGVTFGRRGIGEWCYTAPQLADLGACFRPCGFSVEKLFLVLGYLAVGSPSIALHVDGFMVFSESASAVGNDEPSPVSLRLGSELPLTHTVVRCTLPKSLNSAAVERIVAVLCREVPVVLGVSSLNIR